MTSENPKFVEGKKFFDSLNNLMNFDKTILPSVNKTLKEWVEDYQEAIEWSGTGRLEEQPIMVVQDIILVLKRGIENRALEGFRLMAELVDELEITNNVLSKQLEKRSEHENYLNSLVDRIDPIVKKLETFSEDKLPKESDSLVGKKKKKLSHDEELRQIIERGGRKE